MVSSRQTALKLLAGICVCILGVGCSDRPVPSGQSQDQNPVRPNVIFVSIDDMNDWIEPLGGHPDAVTPNMSRLANRGMTFTNAHTAAPACNPSRVSLMTGLAPTTTGVYANADYPLRKVLPEADTMVQHFMRDGYHVAGFGKLFHRDDNRTETWSEYDWTSGRPRPDPKPAHGSQKLVKDIYRFFDWGPIDAPESEWGEYKATSLTLDVLSRDHDKPFFIAVGYRLPHLPWYAPRRYFELYDPNRIAMPEVPADDLDDVPEEAHDIESKNHRAHELVTEIDGGWRGAVVGYLASISFVDAQLGRILDGLAQSDYRDNTIVVLWSDHGFHLGEKFRWRKFTMWEESTRVPVIIAGPGVAEPGSRSDTPVSLLDLYPTLIELTGISAKPGLDGLSLLPLLQNPAASLPREYVQTTTEDGRTHTVRGKRWRYTRYRDGGEELFDHQTDTGEFTNLAGDQRYRDTKATLAEQLQPGVDRQ